MSRTRRMGDMEIRPSTMRSQGLHPTVEAPVSSPKGPLMEASTIRIFSPARVVGIVLIASAALGLTYLRWSPADATVAAPAQAQDGEVTLESCRTRPRAGAWPPTAARSWCRRTATIPPPASLPYRSPASARVPRARDIRSSASRADRGRRTWTSTRQTGWPKTMTSSWSGTAASTGPCDSTAPRLSPR